MKMLFETMYRAVYRCHMAIIYVSFNYWDPIFIILTSSKNEVWKFDEVSMPFNKLVVTKYKKWAIWVLKLDDVSFLYRTHGAL